MSRKLFRVPHPGWACCDPDQNLAGWIAGERRRVGLDWRWARAWSTRAARLRAEATRAMTRGDRGRSAELDRLARDAYFTAASYWQRALVKGGHLERVSDAHKFRLES